MFGWFSKACTVDPVTRQWIQSRWKWLTNEFGSETMVGRPTVLPDADFFPDQYDRSENSAQALFRRVCGYMGTDSQTMEVEFYSEDKRLRLVNKEGHAIGGTAGTYHKGDTKFVIRLERTQLENPMLLMGTIAHELAHARLLGEGRLDPDAFDNELLTDLTVVFHGLGIFLANHPRHWRSDASNWPDTNLLKPEYMTTPMYGYALAYRCWLREETLIKWRRHLNPGVRAEFDQAGRFLRDLQNKRDHR